jgi:hypothetical protein
LNVVHDHCELVSKTQDELKAENKSELMIVLVEWQKKIAKNAGHVAEKRRSPTRWDRSLYVHQSKS